MTLFLISGCSTPANLAEYLQAEYHNENASSLAVVTQKDNTMHLVSFSIQAPQEIPRPKLKPIEESDYQQLAALQLKGIKLELFANNKLTCLAETKELLESIFKVLKQSGRNSGFVTNQHHAAYLTDEKNHFSVNPVIHGQPIKSLHYLDCNANLFQGVIEKIQHITHEATHIEVNSIHPNLFRRDGLDRLTNEFIAVKMQRCFTEHPPYFYNETISQGIYTEEDYAGYLLQVENLYKRQSQKNHDYYSNFAKVIFDSWALLLKKNNKPISTNCNLDLSSKTSLYSERKSVQAILVKYGVRLH
ncbi:hypothetical protein [Pseudoalteromonas sp. T1lg75]|uniref:hypothetical protein n=1 Tax=Pseudoalteromonas sp. T1lg75 TaxID=2077102 RepID=UPI001319CDF2|nr:hypothetical protein [Pseudoalteromonas sp. T1lg75]